MSIVFKFLLSLIMVIFLIQPQAVFANQSVYLPKQELNSLGFTDYEKINPNLVIFPIKRIYEQLRSILILGQNEKKKYLFKLYEIRFNELVYIINYNKTGFFIETVDRYNTFAGTLKDKVSITRQRDKILRYKKILEVLRDRYPSDSPYWKKIQEAVDVTYSLT